MSNRFLRTSVFLGLLAVLIAGCGRLPEISRGNDESPRQIAAAPTCTDTFSAHPLDFTTTVRSQPVRMFDSNGAGVAVDDLDHDGDLDIVLANLGGPNAVLWNLGDLAFHRQDFAYGDSRAVAIVDVDGDGWRDVVFTTRLGAPLWWRNTGIAETLGVSEDSKGLEQRFAQQTLPGVMAPAYAMAWGDLDLDGDLDLVTGSYDAELEQVLRDSFMFGGGAGVYYYENRDGTFFGQRLAEEAQALTITLFDVNDDGRLDIVVGNDFGVQDAVWLHSADGWQPAQPFAATANSTMSFAPADIDNDGREDLFATDMKPYAGDPQTLAQWQPVMEGMHHAMVEGDPQIMENVLQVRQAGSAFENQAAGWGVAATGWSWSSQFGDLDNDGWLDLYVVNGMIAEELFGHLPGNELVENNQAFRNNGQRFISAPQWGLDATASGRGMALADLDNDGDLDAVVNNLLAPAMLYENQLCAGQALEVELRWPGSGNVNGLGAIVTLHTSNGVLLRTVRADSGYASGGPGRVHFGLPDGASLERLEVRWPDGAASRVDAPEPGVLLTITRKVAP